jgi:hypothetical protein
MAKLAPDRLQTRVGHLTRQIAELHGPRFPEAFADQPDATIGHKLFSEGLLKFRSQELRDAVGELLWRGAETLGEVNDAICHRIIFNRGRMQALRDMSIDDFQCIQLRPDHPAAIDGEPLHLDALREGLQLQFGERHLGETGVNTVYFSPSLLVYDEGRAHEVGLEEASERDDWYHLRSFADGKRALAFYDGISGVEPARVGVFAMDGRRMPKHLRGLEQWKQRELHGTVVHELGHGLMGSWRQSRMNDWVRILQAEQHKEPLTYYLDRYRRGVWKVPPGQHLNSHEEFCESLKVFATNTAYLQAYSHARVEFIMNAYPALQDSDMLAEAGCFDEILHSDRVHPTRPSNQDGGQPSVVSIAA